MENCLLTCAKTVHFASAQKYDIRFPRALFSLKFEFLVNLISSYRFLVSETGSAFSGAPCTVLYCTVLYCTVLGKHGVCVIGIIFIQKYWRIKIQCESF